MYFYLFGLLLIDYYWILIKYINVEDGVRCNIVHKGVQLVIFHLNKQDFRLDSPNDASIERNIQVYFTFYQIYPLKVQYIVWNRNIFLGF